jgi:hypothetical protein
VGDESGLDDGAAVMKAESDERAGARRSVVVRTRGVFRALVARGTDPAGIGYKRSASARKAHSTMMYTTNEMYITGCVHTIGTHELLLLPASMSLLVLAIALF